MATARECKGTDCGLFFIHTSYTKASENPSCTCINPIGIYLAMEWNASLFLLLFCLVCLLLMMCLLCMCLHVWRSFDPSLCTRPSNSSNNYMCRQFQTGSPQLTCSNLQCRVNFFFSLLPCLCSLLVSHVRRLALAALLACVSSLALNPLPIAIRRQPAVAPQWERYGPTRFVTALHTPVSRRGSCSFRRGRPSWVSRTH